MMILEINSCDANPEFLHQKVFYEAINTAGNLFFVDVMVRDVDNINEDFITSQLTSIRQQLIIQCSSSLNTKVYFKGAHGNVIVADLNSPVENYNEDILTNKLCSEFGIDLIVDALKQNLIGTFETERRSLLKVNFDWDKFFNTWKLIDRAVRYGDVLTVRLLSLYTWNLSKFNPKRTLGVAAKYGNIDKLAAVLRVKFPIQLDDSNISLPKETAAHFDKCREQMLHIAAEVGNRDIISFMIRCGVQLDKKAMELAWDDYHYDVVLMMLRADCVFPIDFDLDVIDENDASLDELKTLVAERDHLHSLIEDGNLDSVNAYLKVIPPSKFYLNKDNKSAVKTALLNDRLNIFVWLKFDLEVDFRDETERTGISVGDRDRLTEALVPHFVPVDNAHILHLVAKSRSRRHYPGFKEHIENIYKELDEIPQISTVFKVIQFCDHVDIIYDFDRDSIVDVNVASSESDKGFCEYKAGRIYIGAKVDKRDLLGTIAHELTHLAVQTVYNNDCNPYKLGDSIKADFDVIVREIKGKSVAMDSIIRRVFICYGKDCWPSELIVRVNHMLATYGSEDGLKLLEVQANSLLKFYTDRVEPRFKLLVAESHLIKPRNTIKFLNEYSGVIGRLGEMKIQFNESTVVKEFLSNKDKHILVLSSTSTWLSLINVYQNIKEVSSSEDSLLIFQFDHYVSRRIEINQAVYTEAGKLLVIECPNEMPEQEFEAALSGLGHLVRKKSDKKVILVIEANELDFLQKHFVPKLFNLNFDIVYDDAFTLNSLTPNSQQTLLKYNVSLQNRLMPLGDLLDPGSHSLVDAEVLTRLVNNETVSIGKQPNVPYGYDEVYYVGRAFNNQVKLRKSILDDKHCTDIFAISESTVAVVKMLVKNKHRVCSFGEFEADERLDPRYIVLDSDDAENQFKSLRNKFETRTIHWLEVEVGDFIWHKSQCSLTDFPLLINHLKNSDFQKSLRKYIEDIAETSETVHFDCGQVVQAINDEIKKAKQSIEGDDVVQFDKIIVNNDIFNFDNDIIAVSDTDEATIQKLISNNIPVQYYNENELINANYIILDSNQANKQFNQLCAKFPLRNIHWLKREISGLLWHQTSAVSDLHRGFKDVLTALRHHIDHSFTEVYHEDDFVHKIDDFKVVLVPDTAGMGKTTVLTRMIKLLNTNHPQMWVIRVDLNDYTRALDHPSADVRENDEALNFFVTRLLDSRKESKLETAFERKLLLNLVKNRDDRVVIMFDGFDEIKESHQTVIVCILNALKQTKVKQIWVTTRPFIRNYLEDQLQMLPYTLEPFTETEQISFLVNYWGQRFNGKVDEERLGRYADALIKHLSKSISDKAKTFSGIPLQTRMIAEAFEGHCEEFCKSDLLDPVIPENFDLIDLYKLFLEYKYKIYQLEKNELDPSKPQVEWQMQKWYPKFLENHQISAFFTLLDEADRNRLLTKSDIEAGQSFIKDIEDGKGNTGVIDRIVEGQPHFVHLTFAEYLIAEFIVNILKRTRRNNKLEKYVLISVFGSPVFEVVRAFVDSHLSKNTLPNEALNNYGVQIRKMWSEGGNPLKVTNGQTVLHVAAKEGNVNIAKFLLSSVEMLGESGKSTLDGLVRAEDEVSMQALHLAAQAGHRDLLKLLFDYGVDKNAAFMGTKKKITGNALYLAAKSGNFNLCDWMLEQGLDINAPLRGHKKFDGMKLIDLAAQQGDLVLIKWLVNHGVDVNTVVNDNERYEGCIPMHIAAMNGQWSVVTWLVSEKFSDINRPICKGNIKINPFAPWIARGFEVSDIKQMWNLGLDMNGTDEKGQTALHIAAFRDAYELAKCLIECGASVNMRDEYDYTPLHEAADRGHPRLVQLLLEHGADPNVESSCFKKKPIDFALKNKNLVIIEMLKEKH